LSSLRKRSFNIRSPSESSDIPCQSLNDFRSIDGCPFPSGVYAIVQGDDVYYIGQSVNFKARIKAHRSSKKWMSDSMEILVFPLAHRDARLTLETQLILKYRPLHNRLCRIQFRKDGTVYETIHLEYRKPRAKATKKKKK